MNIQLKLQPLGSKEKFKATINRELLENNSTTVTNEIDDNYDQNKHYTKNNNKKGW